MTEKAKEAVVEKELDTKQPVETDAYVPTYKVKPELKQAVLQAIGDRPFNEIAGLINAINVPTMDHQTLTQVINVIGQFPYVRVEKLLQNVNSYVEQVIPED
ncbi:hypothetical protein KY334_06240 [Candidatus Woesearchaeota archaeon]|nr:hypothetical protein [Candidatus Woesearchaeota archaeon]